MIGLVSKNTAPSQDVANFSPALQRVGVSFFRPMDADWMRKEAHMPGRILVCVNHRFGTAPSCGARGGGELLAAFQAAAMPFGIVVEPIHCFGMCAQGANVRIAPGGPFFHDVKPEQVAEIVTQAKAFGGEEVSEARWAPGS